MGDLLEKHIENDKESRDRDFRKTAAIIACSNGLPENRRFQVEKLRGFLRDVGITSVLSDCLYRRNGTEFSGSPKERAEELMRFYRDPRVGMIFDISGGDGANEILPFLSFGEIENAEKLFWGYSDLTVLLNAFYAKTGRMSVLYQVRNLAERSGEWQRTVFRQFVDSGEKELFRFSCRFIRQKRMEGILVGGNIRCLLKLAGTEFWPDMRGKILLLEAMRGRASQMASYLAHLAQLGVFQQVNGILLGTFIEMEEEGCRPGIRDMILEYAGRHLPVAETSQIGHRPDSHGALIGREVILEEKKGECG